MLALEDVVGPRDRLMGIDELVLQQRDVRVYRPRGEALRVETKVADHITGEPDSVGLVVDREVARVTNAVAVGAKDSHARRVEGAHPHRLDHRTNERSDSLAHLTRRLVGKGDGENRCRRNP